MLPIRATLVCNERVSMLLDGLASAERELKRQSRRSTTMSYLLARAAIWSGLSRLHGLSLLPTYYARRRIPRPKGQIMNLPDWIKPGAYGVLIGAVAATILGFSWGGWVTQRAAGDMAGDMAHDASIAALIPICVEMARTDPNRTEQLAIIQAASTYQRRDAVMAAGWATMPGSETADRDLALACIAGLDLDGS